ncbi:hypothetical protein LQE92_08895 [Lacrimispora sp. NSJ-141]|uniref:Uncharacterized protein n=1 Tax=Lientehia hominis TaxID=2897778 RepID=A0AAP2WA77_9FIRM|nr:hypothetical protein [Lientehia hominis]MCD2492744.1 hypothetical protein [Lientehia hominis]
MNCAQIIRGIAQAIILLLQVFIASWTLNLSKQQKKGVFQISYNNFGAGERDGTKKQWNYDLGEMLVFYNIGDDFAKLTRSILIVNGRQITNDALPLEMTFGNKKGQFDTYLVDLGMDEHLLNESLINVELNLELENSTGYKYKQIISIQFEKIQDHSVWSLRKYNWIIKKR